MTKSEQNQGSSELSQTLSPIEQLGRTRALLRQRDAALFEVVCLSGEVERLNQKLKDYSDALQIAGERRQELQTQLSELMSTKHLHTPHDAFAMRGNDVVVTAAATSPPSNVLEADFRPFTPAV